MTTGTSVFIGLDLGTSGLKGVALDESGTVLGHGSAAYPTHRPVPHAAEQDPADWLDAAERVAAQLAGQVAATRWRAIGLSAMLPTLVTAGPGGAVLGQAITWEDSRAEYEAERLREACGGSGLYQRTGQWLDGRYLLPMFVRLAVAEPARAAATTAVLGAKDYFFGQLTGQVATDPGTAAGFGCYQLATGQWDADVLAAGSAQAAQASHAGMPGPGGSSGLAALLPPIRPTTMTAPLRPEIAARLGCAQIPVCLGAPDSVLGALGLGVDQPGQIAYVAGTSTVILGVTDRLVFDPEHRFLVTPLAEPGSWGLEMDLLATGSSLRWLADLLGEGMSEPDLIAIAAKVAPDDAPVVLPYLSPGEQGALWDPALRGTIAGLTFGHGRPQLARGLVNGILVESRRCLAVLEATAPFGRDLRVAGGSATEPSFRADLANATGRRVIMPDGRHTDYSALGAAMLAARATGTSLQVRPDTGDPDAGGALSQVHQPDPGQAEAWRRVWTSYEKTRLAITSHYRTES
ncbi:MAG TPA: FGGY-family carbohydrate kinase [Streptosporangiaceae bacterium]